MSKMSPKVRLVSLLTVILLLSGLVMPKRIRASQSTEGVVAEVNRSYLKYLAFNDLTVKFTFKYAHVNGPRNFALDDASLVTKRSGLRLHLKFVGKRFDRAAERELSYAWDGKTGTVLEGGDFAIINHPDPQIFAYNFYVDAISYPEATGYIPTLTKGDVKSSVTFLPDELTRNTAKYVTSYDTIDGLVCVKLDWPGHNTFWFDPSKGYALIRREIYNTRTNRLARRVSLSDHESHLSSWLPKRAFIEEYSDRLNPDGGLTGTKLIEVQSISLTPIRSSEFRLLAPVGVTVHDRLNKRYYTRVEKGSTALENSAQLARRRYGARGWMSNAYYIVAGGLICGGYGIWKVSRGWPVSYKAKES